MKIKITIICIAVFCIAAASIFLLTQPKALCSITQIYTKPETSTSDASFSGETGDKIKISLSTRIDGGDLDVFLYDSKGNVVYELDRAKELRTYFTFEYSDTYTLAAEYNNFVGKFDIRLYEAD